MANSNGPHEQTVVFLVTPGDVLDGRWLIENRIGQGAMGSVFRGKDEVTKTPVAVKILSPEHCRKPKVLARFEREARLLATLRHPNIVQLHGVGRRGALPYIVMQFLEGLTLGDAIKRKPTPLSMGETVAIIKQVAAGLSFIHHHGMVHRDVKPQNVFVSPAGHVTILDLGVVRDPSDPGLTRAGAMVGTPYYMSPEQIDGKEEIDKRTDVYALAVMTFELLCGRPPFLGQNNFEVLRAHRQDEIPNPSTLNSAVSPQVAAVLVRGMAKKREKRPASALEFAADLEASLHLNEKVDLESTFSFLALPRAKSNERDQASDFVSTDHGDSQQTDHPVNDSQEPTVSKTAATDLVSDDDGSFRGELRVITTVNGLTVPCELFVDGIQRANAPVSVLVGVGPHEVLVRRKGFTDQKRVAQVSADDVALVRIELERFDVDNST